MAVITPLVLNNGTIDITFTPSSKKGNSVTWTGPADSVALVPRITSDAFAVTSSKSLRRVKYTVAYPIKTTSLNGVNAIEFAHFNLDMKVPLVMSSADVQKFRIIFSNLFKDSLISDQIDNGNNPY